MPGGGGVEFALFSRHATAVELCLFDHVAAMAESRRLLLCRGEGNIWRTRVEDLGPGALYGYRVHGPYDPERGHRFNPSKLLTDPYARLTARPASADSAMFSYALGNEKEDLVVDRRDNAHVAPLSVVVDGEFDWRDDRPPAIPWEETIIYETHVKGLTWRHPGVPEKLRGTFAGLATDAVIGHLRDLGVTAVELMPVHQHYDEHHLLKKGLSNYWGYNTLSFFAPDTRFSSGGQDAVCEFKSMVRALHAAGIEMILDVVYNHSAEGNHLGPTLCYRGIDNAGYYRLKEGAPRFYEDVTGCGNSLDAGQPQVTRLVLDSLRYWAGEMHVDGFRFDLASTLARNGGGIDFDGPFFQALREDPLLSRVKLIAEPWDLGRDGYQVGNFPAPFSEWNGKYRDTLRRYWRGDENTIAETASRLSGSSDLFGAAGRPPRASINFITSHDGFTLEDLVSYKRKHNDANLEENLDGCGANFSWNCGVEGPTRDPEIRAIRARQKRNLMASLLLSKGVPLILGGDELGRTQGGNNNPYCQDNATSHYSWALTQANRRFLEFTRQMVALRKSHPEIVRDRFFKGEVIPSSNLKDIAWLAPDGKEMTLAEWHDPDGKSFGYQVGPQPAGKEPAGPVLLVLLNAGETDVRFTLPRHSGRNWETLTDTADQTPPGENTEHYPLAARSIAVLALKSQPPRPA
jgi:glycogen operon protein